MQIKIQEETKKFYKFNFHVIFSSLHEGCRHSFSTNIFDLFFMYKTVLLNILNYNISLFLTQGILVFDEVIQGNKIPYPKSTFCC